MRFKRGMTLFEAFLVFIVIGIIAVVTLITLKPWERQYYKMYSRVYESVNTALYNYIADRGEFPRTVNELCSAFATYMNTVNDISECSVNNLGSNPVDADFTEASSLTLSNGVKLWFGGRNAYNCPDDNSKSCEYLTYSGVNYFFVYADLNGDLNPNTIVYQFNKLSDRVPMAVTDKYVTVPLSYPKLDTRYLRTTVVYPPQSEDDEESTSEPMPFYKAQRLAFGFGNIETPSNPLTYVIKDDKDFDWNIGSNFAIDFNNSNIQALTNTITPAEIDSRCSLTSGYYSGATEPICRVEINEYN